MQMSKGKLKALINSDFRIYHNDEDTFDVYCNEYWIYTSGSFIGALEVVTRIMRRYDEETYSNE